MPLHIIARQKLSITIVGPAPAAPAPVDTSRHETGDRYDRVLFLAPGGRFRIIVCCDDRQWITQTRRPFTSKSPRPWSARGFCTSKLGINRSLGKPRIASILGLREFIDSLPDKFARGAFGE